uniref:KIAA0825 n=1 Tax=Zonotrichia albicollis TaxID=44394 RepID=A0A8D2MVZ1_ZONAL
MEWGGEYSFDSSNLDCLLDVLPGELEFRQILSDLDEKIKKNSSSIEKCLKDLQLDINEICTDEVLQSTTDCIQWLNNCNFSSLRPSSTDHGELLEFLKTLQSLLKNEKNQEEMVLHFLLDLSSQCGVSFPCTASGTSFEITSSLHTIQDDSAVDVKSLWDDVRLHLRQFLVNRLQSQEETNTNASQQQMEFKTQCVQQLLFLYPKSEVLMRYQNMQNKLVSDLLQNCILSSCGETNFDKVVHGYQSSIPRLCTMIKEDLYILSGTIGPSSSLKFINETYLDTITEEMTVLLERLCELQFKENALHIVKANKISKKHGGRVHAVASQEYQRKGRNFCLTLYQLKCLSQLIKLFLLMEEKIEELSTEFLLLPSFTERNKNVQGVLKRASGEFLIGETRANETSVLPEQLLQVEEPILLSFGWRNAFKDLSSSVAHCITIAIEDFSSKILQHEQKEEFSAAGCAMSLVNNQQMRESCRAVQQEEQPKRIAKFCSDIMEELDTLLPLALACRDDSLQEIRANFVEACSKVATAVLARLEEKSKDVPLKAPLQDLYAALSTAIYVFQHFTTYSNLMRETSKKPLFLVPIQKCQEFINTLQFQVTNYCIRVCATSILQDAESHCWDDYKAFYEGERCSFSVQMWHYFCCALHHDLWTILPPKTAQEILTDVLERSLDILCSRYCQVCPSYKRTTQIRVDIAAILMSTEDMLWSICSSAQEFLNPHKDRNLKIYKIHSHCNSLISVLAILTSPLKNLYETFLDNSDEHLPQDFSEVFYHPLHWLFCIPSSCFFFQKTPSAREMASQGLLKLLLSQPYCHLNLLLETLLHHDCFLVKILLRSSSNQALNCGEQSSLLEQENNKEPTLIETIFTVLSYCTLSPKSLGIAFESYMEKELLWSCLYNMTGFTRLAAQAVSIVISKLPTVIACLPPPVKYFFFLAERKMSRNFAELKKAGLLVWNLIVIICQIFEDGNTAEFLTGATLDRWSKEKLSLVRVCLESIMGKQKSGPKQVTQKIIQSIEQQRPNWIESQLLKARKLSIDCVSVTVKGATLEEGGIALGLSEHNINMMVLDICHKPGGSEYLRQIYHIIRLNEEYLKEQLSCENSSEDGVTSSQYLPLTLKGREEQPVFNPFQVYRQSYAKVFNQSAITEWNWDWSSLLPGHLGQNQMAFKVLLSQRWEMKEDADLEDEEHIMVEHLRNVYLTQRTPVSEDKEEQLP